MTDNSSVVANKSNSVRLAGDLDEKGYADQGWVDALLEAPDLEQTLCARNSEGSPLLHSFLRVRWAGRKGSRIEGLSLLLDHGADVDATNSRGWTALHVAATEVDVSLEELLLLVKKSKEVDAVNHNGDTPLYLLLSSSKFIDEDSMVAFLEAGANPFLVMPDHTSPFHVLLEKSDKPKQHLNLVRRHANEGFQENLEDSLKYAVTDCSVAAVEALLECCDHTGDTVACQSDLVLEAALSKRDWEEKIEALIGHGVPCDAHNSSGMNLLHLGAAKGSLWLMKLTGSRHNVDASAADVLSNTPLHYVNIDGRLTNPEAVLACVEYLQSLDADLNAVNSDGESPLTKALAAGQTALVGALVKAGASLPKVGMLQHLEFNQVSGLAENALIAVSKCPLVMTLQLGGLMQRLARTSKLDEEGYVNLSRAPENSAIGMINSEVPEVSDVNEEVLFAAVENNQKQFVADKKVQDYVRLTMRGDRYSRTRPILYAVLDPLTCYLRLFILPFLVVFYALPRYGRNYNAFTKTFLMDKTSLYVRYTTSVLVYVFFILILIIDTSRLYGLPVSIRVEAVDFVVFFFVIGMALQAFAQMHMAGVQKYFSRWRNGLDIVTISLFLCHFIMRFVDWSGVWNPKSGNAQLGPFLRLATVFFGVGAFIACLRFLAYLHPFQTIGPILIAFKNILKETASFLVIWALFLVAFSVAMTTIYASTVYANSDLDCVLSKANTTDVQTLSRREWRMYRYRCADEAYNTVVPVVVRGQFRTAVNLFYASFGLIETSDFRTDSEPETVIGETFLCLWLLTGVIVLVNLLVAIVTNAFQNIQDHADVEWKFATARNFIDVINSPIFVPPVNILYYFAVGFAWAVTFPFSKHEGVLFVNENVSEGMEMMENPSGNENCDEGGGRVLTLLKRLEEEELKSSSATRGDLQRLEDKIDQIQNFLVGFGSSSVRCPRCQEPVSLYNNGTSVRDEEFVSKV